jgi:hypothetical protein
LIAQGFCVTKRDQFGRAWLRKFCRCREIELETGGGPVGSIIRELKKSLFESKESKFLLFSLTFSSVRF